MDTRNLRTIVRSRWVNQVRWEPPSRGGLTCDRCDRLIGLDPRVIERRDGNPGALCEECARVEGILVYTEEEE